MIYERIKSLCKDIGISVNELEKRIGVAKGYLCKIDKHKPSSEKIQAIAKELSTSVDFLISGKDSDIVVEMANKDLALSNMSERIKDYALILNQMPAEQQEHIISLIDMLNKSNQ